jgi:hypothetical protein
MDAVVQDHELNEVAGPRFGQRRQQAGQITAAA